MSLLNSYNYIYFKLYSVTYFIYLITQKYLIAFMTVTCKVTLGKKSNDTLCSASLAIHVCNFQILKL